MSSGADFLHTTTADQAEIPQSDCMDAMELNQMSKAENLVFWDLGAF